jgi:hypothetical protein
MNLRQMQMEYGLAPNGRVMLVPAKPQYQFSNRMLPRDQQAKNRAKKGDYRVRGVRPAHDSAWK